MSVVKEKEKIGIDVDMLQLRKITLLDMILPVFDLGLPSKFVVNNET